jgi:hypothetical protein
MTYRRIKPIQSTCLHRFGRGGFLVPAGATRATEDNTMKEAIFAYSERMVCDTCGTNDQIHYNLFLRHGTTSFMADPDCEAWCNTCQKEASFVDPEWIEGEVVYIGAASNSFVPRS